MTGYPLLGPIYQEGDLSHGPTGFSVQQLSGNTPLFGIQLDRNYIDEPNGPLAVFAAEEGTFFGYVALRDKVNVLDLSGNDDNWGSVDPPYMKPSGSIAWPNVTDIHVTNIPGRHTQFLVAKSGQGTQKPVWRIAELNAASGRVLKQKTVTFNASGYKNYLSGTFSSAGGYTVANANDEWAGNFNTLAGGITVADPA